MPSILRIAHSIYMRFENVWPCNVENLEYKIWSLSCVKW